MRARLVPLDDVTPDLHQRWQALSEQALESNPFYEPDAVLLAAGTLPGGDRAALLLVEDDDSTELHFALPVLPRRPFRRIPVPALVAWQHPYCFLGVPLLRRGSEHEAWGVVVDLGKEPGTEAWLVLPRLTLDGACAVALQDVLASRSVRSTALDGYGRPVLRRRAECTYLDGRVSSRHRKSLRRQRRRLTEELGAELEVVDVAAMPGVDLDRAVAAFLELEAAGWKGRAGTAIASRPEDAEWFRQLAARLHRQGRLQLCALRAGARVAAWQCNLVSGETVFHFKIAYDEVLARYSPGLQLELAMVDDFHRDRRLMRVDSCVDADNRVSAQLFPDRDVVGTLAVPLRTPVGAVAVRAAAAVTQGRELLSAARRRVTA